MNEQELMQKVDKALKILKAKEDLAPQKQLEEFLLSPKKNLMRRQVDKNNEYVVADSSIIIEPNQFSLATASPGIKAIWQRGCVIRSSEFTGKNKEGNLFTLHTCKLHEVMIEWI